MKKFNMATTIMIFIAMIFAAVAENTKGIFIPIFKNDFNVNDTKIAFMLTGASIGYILFTYIGGILCEKIGQKKVFIWGFAAIIASLFMLSDCNNFVFLTIAMVIMSIGLSLVSIATNTIIPILFLSYQAIVMNLTHFCYGLGSTAGQSITGMLIYKGTNWRHIYLIVGCIYVIILISFLFIKVPKANKVSKLLIKDNKPIFKNKLVAFYAIALGTYAFAEIATGNWFVNYMEKGFSINTDKSAFYLALFYGIFTVGRLVGGFIVEKKGYLNTVLIFLIIAVLLYSSGIILKQNGMIIISISGFFFSIAFPTIVLSISKVFEERSSYITGIVITCSSTTNMLLNLLMGHLNDNIGVYKAFYLIPISLSVSIFFVYMLYSHTKTMIKNY